MPKDIQVPLLEVKQEDLDAALAKVQPGGVSDILYSVDETVKIVDKE